MKVLNMPADPELTHNEAAEFLGLKPSSLYDKNNLGEGPRRVRRFGRLKYPLKDLQAYKKHNEEIFEAYK